MQTETEIEERVLDFGRRLRAAREAAGLSQLVLAERAGVDLAAVSFLERAKRAPNLNTLVRVARAAGVAPAALLGDAAAGGARDGGPPEAGPMRGRARTAAGDKATAGRGAGATRRGGGNSAGKASTQEALLRFGANLRGARLEASMSQEELSATARIDRAAISIIERGGRSANLRSIVKLADALGKQPAELLSGVE